MKRPTAVCPWCGAEGAEPCNEQRTAERPACAGRPRTTMRNLAMARKLITGEALDVRAIGKPLPGGPGLYVLDRYVDGKDYCDASEEAWIWSIGRSLADGRILAATDARFYQHPDYECLWLR